MEDRRQDGNRTAVRAIQALMRQRPAQQYRVVRHPPAHARLVPRLALQQDGHLRVTVPVADEPDQIGETPFQVGTGGNPFLRQGRYAVQLQRVPKRPTQIRDHQVPRDDGVAENGLAAGVERVGREAVGHGLSLDA